MEVEDVARGQHFEVVVSRVATEADCMQSVFRPSMQCESRREKRNAADSEVKLGSGHQRIGLRGCDFVFFALDRLSK